MTELTEYKGSGASLEHPHQECVFLIKKLGTDDKIVADWFRATAGWRALDEAESVFGNCEIVKSYLASEYDAYCIAHSD